MAAAAGGKTSGEGPIGDDQFDLCAKMLKRGAKYAREKDGWETVGDEVAIAGDKAKCGSLRLWKRKKEGTGGLFEYFAHGTLVGTNAETMYAVGQDREHRMTWDGYAIEIETLEEFEDNCVCQYWSVKFPWPLTNRDYVYFRRNKRDPKTGAYFQVSEAGEHEKRPVHKKFVRVHTFTNTLAMNDTEDGTVEFVLLYFDDPNGNIPKAMINWAVSTAVPDFMKQLRQVCIDYPEERIKMFSE